MEESEAHRDRDPQRPNQRTTPLGDFGTCLRHFVKDAFGAFKERQTPCCVTVRAPPRGSLLTSHSSFGVACGYIARYKRRLGMLMEAMAVCRSIKTLFNFEPPATEQEIQAASLQFVRKLSGFNSPSQANRVAFDRAVDEVAASARALIGALVTTAEPRDREVEAERARIRTALRFGARPRT
jgi:hypothetical protein